MNRVNKDDIEIEYTAGGSPVYTWQGEPFTGVGYELGNNGALLSETSYVDGAEDGVERSWYINGQLESVSGAKWNRPHGSFQYWYENGQPKYEGEAELGHVLWRKEWDENGKLTNEYHIESDPEQYNALLMDREFFKKHGLI